MNEKEQKSMYLQEVSPKKWVKKKNEGEFTTFDSFNYKAHDSLRSRK